MEISLEDPPNPLIMWFKPRVVYDHDTGTLHLTKYMREEEIEEALTHEVIHQMLCILEGKKTSHAFDSPRVETFIGKHTQVRVS